MFATLGNAHFLYCMLRPSLVACFLGSNLHFSIIAYQLFALLWPPWPIAISTALRHTANVCFNRVNANTYLYPQSA
jgi:hypothetical protein